MRYAVAAQIFSGAFRGSEVQSRESSQQYAVHFFWKWLMAVECSETGFDVRDRNPGIKGA